jgi:hypothetical protein
MSLQKLAKHLETAGRNNDSMLVHMSPREVSGLQSLARQHGGDLTINPTTGLVEAGFLDSILPMIAGAALTATGVGAPLAAALVGGGTGLATGSVEKGLMAGLGAYGGAGLGSSLTNAGAAAAPASTAATVTPNAAAIPGVTSNVASSATSPITNNLLNPSTNNVLGSGFTNTVPNEAFTASFSPDKMLADAAKGTTTIPSQAIPVPPANTFGANLDKMGTGFSDVTKSFDKFGDFASQNKGNLLMSAAPLAYSMTNPNSSLFSKDKPNLGPQKTKSTQRPYEFSTEQNEAAYSPGESTAEQSYFNEPRFTALPTYTAREGGLMGYAVGGPVENMSAQNAIGNNTMYPQSQMQTPMYSNPMVQRPISSNVIQSGLDAPVNTYTGDQRMAQGGLMGYAKGGVPQPSDKFEGGNMYGNLLNYFASDMNPSAAVREMFSGDSKMVPPGYNKFINSQKNNKEKEYANGGGLKSYNLGDYSDGGRLLKGPGDGVSDSIPASIGDRQPARLADGEFVVPARIVSELGNGSTEAGARKLYAMMDRVQKQRSKTTGKGKVAVNSKADKHMPV